MASITVTIRRMWSVRAYEQYEVVLVAGREVAEESVVAEARERKVPVPAVMARYELEQFKELHNLVSEIQNVVLADPDPRDAPQDGRRPLPSTPATSRPVAGGRR